jgi:hypothetical protein
MRRSTMSTNPLQQSTSNGGLQTVPDRLEFVHSTADTDVEAAAPVGGLERAAGRIPPVEWHGVRKNCLVNVSAKAGLSWIRNPGEPLHLGLLVTVSGDIHNPHVFVGIDVPFSVEVLVDNVQNESLSFNLFAPAVLDPRGSDQWYTWKREADEIDPADLSDLDKIRLQITI